MSVLSAIVEKKRERLAAARAAAPVSDLKLRIEDMGPLRDFAGAVKRSAGGVMRLIAEMKRASPSKGPLREDYRPAEIAEVYAGLASAISVITEEDFFLGSLAHIREARISAPLPVLRKDFVIDDYLIYESRAAGADAILLIGDMLEKSQAREYLHLAGELGLGVLFEVHDEEGLEKALEAGAQIIGVNNRDLSTFKIDLATTLRLRDKVPAGKVLVSESGIERRAEVQRLSAAGVDAILVGTAFMEAKDIAKKIKELMGS